MKILVVDDEPGLRQTLTRILGAEGHVTITAGDGQEALARLEPDDVDIVLCDLRMPTMSGLEMIENEAALLTIGTIFAVGFVILTLPLGLFFGWLGKRMAVAR